MVGGVRMVFARYYRNLIASRTLAPPWAMSEQEARRYRCWQRHTRRMRALDKAVHGLRMLLVRRYTDELRRINADDGQDSFTFPDGRHLDKAELAAADGKAGYSRASGNLYQPSEHFEHERWRRS